MKELRTSAILLAKPAAIISVETALHIRDLTTSRFYRNLIFKNEESKIK
jgi:hypothetical protein